MAKLKVLESTVTVLQDDYISLIDMVRNIENGLVLINKWLRNKNTIEFIGIWEEIYNVDFNSPEFEGIKQIAIKQMDILLNDYSMKKLGQ